MTAIRRPSAIMSRRRRRSPARCDSPRLRPTWKPTHGHSSTTSANRGVQLARVQLSINGGPRSRRRLVQRMPKAMLGPPRPDPRAARQAEKPRTDEQEFSARHRQASHAQKRGRPVERAFWADCSSRNASTASWSRWTGVQSRTAANEAHWNEVPGPTSSSLPSTRLHDHGLPEHRPTRSYDRDIQSSTDCRS